MARKRGVWQWGAFILLSAVAFSVLAQDSVVVGHFKYVPGIGSENVYCNSVSRVGLLCAPTIDGVALQVGDEIALVDSAGHCVGAKMWTGGATILPAMAFDNNSPTISGYKAGKKLTYWIWDSSAHVEIHTVRPHYWPHGTYGSGAVTIDADSLFVSSTSNAALDSLKAFSPPVAPTLLSPSSGSTGITLPPSLSWNAGTGAVSYALQISLGSDFSSTVSSQSGLTGTSASPSALSNNTTYFWRVNFINGGSVTSPWSSVWSFSTVMLPPSAPGLQLPVNNTTNSPLSLTLTWSSASTATSYTVQVSQTSSFSSTILHQTLSGTTQALGSLANSTTYYWHVLATNAGGSSAWSGAWSFSTMPQQPDQPTLSAPANAAPNQPVSVNLSWNAAARADSYGLLVSTANDFSTTFFSNSSPILTTSQSVSGLSNSTIYYWKVNATNAGGTASWSTTWSFATTLVAPTLTSPASGATDQAINAALNWQTVTGATGYTVQVSITSTFSSTVLNQTPSSNSQALSGVANATLYYWRVNATNAGGAGAWSNIWSFTTIIAAPPTPTLSTPSSGSINQQLSLTLNWAAADRASNYTVQVSTDAGFATTITNVTANALSFNQGGLSTSSTYYWKVNASNTGGTSAWSSIWSFSTIPPSVIPALSSPADGAINQPTTLTLLWSSASGALSYHAQLSTASTFATTVSDQSGLSGTSAAVSSLQNSTTYYWRANATNAGGVGAWSSIWTFTTAPLPPSAPTLATPANAALNVSITPTLTWNSVTGATYAAQVSTASDFSTAVFNQSGITAAQQAISGLTNVTVYYWRANASNGGGTSAWAGTWSFTTVILTPDVPILSSPANNATGQSVVPTLSWGAAARAVSYTVQVSTVANFSTTLNNLSGIPSTSQEISGLANNATYYWRANATNDGGTSVWSGAWSFATVLAPPVLSSPGTGSTSIPVTTTLSWNSVAGATSYNLQASVVSDFSSTVFSQTGIGATSLSANGLPNSTLLFWHVSATNSGSTSLWSNTWSFTTIIAIPPAPSLTTPTNGQTDVPKNVALTWGSATGATSYAVQISTEQFFASTVVSQAGITATTMSFSTFLADGVAYYWRVNASNIAGTSDWAATWSFTVAPPSVLPTLSSPANGSANQPIPVTLVWNATAGGISYALQVSVGSDFSTTFYNQAGLTGTSQVVGGLSTSTTYYWRINANNGSGNTAWSSVWSFGTVPPPPAVPALSSPATGATNQQPSLTLNWTASSGATGYTVQVSTTANFSTIAVSQAASGTSLPVSGLLNAVTYYWRANASNAGGTSVWASSWSFTTVVAAPDAPILSAPVSNAINQSVTATTLSWGAAARATSYTVQVSATSTFAATVASQTGSATTYPNVSGLSISTLYYWRVNAINAGGNAWSAIWSFATKNTGTLSNFEVSGKTEFSLRSGTLVYSLAHPSMVEISFYDILGRTALVVNRMQQSGHYNFALKTTSLAAGRYIVRFKAANFEKRAVAILTR